MHILWSNLLFNCILARSAAQVLSTKGGCTSLFPNFLITGLCDSSVDSWIEIYSFPIALS